MADARGLAREGLLRPRQRRGLARPLPRRPPGPTRAGHVRLRRSRPSCGGLDEAERPGPRLRRDSENWSRPASSSGPGPTPTPRRPARTTRTRRDKALASGAQFISTDYPEPRPDFLRLSSPTPRGRHRPLQSGQRSALKLVRGRPGSRFEDTVISRTKDCSGRGQWTAAPRADWGPTSS